METPQRLHNVGGDNPQLRPEDKHILNHRHLKPLIGSGVIPLFAQQTVELAPYPLRYIEFQGHFGQVSDAIQNHHSQVLKGIYLLKDLVPLP